MKPKRLFNVNSFGWIVVFIAIVLLYFSYFFLYVPQQESALNRRAFRILKEYGNSVNEKSNYYKNHIRNYDLFYTLKYIQETKDKGNFFYYILKDPDVVSVINGLEEQVETETIDSSYETNATLFKTISAGQLIDGYLSFEAFGNMIYPDKKIIHKVPINVLMNGLKFDRLFNNIVLLDSAQVLYNYNQDFVQDITNTSAIRDSTQKFQGGIVETFEIRGEKKHVMIVPFRFLDKDYFIAGFIPDDSYRQKTRTIDSQLLIFIAGLLLLVLIGMPVLKLLFITKKERLRAHDATWSTLSLIGGISLLVLVLISLLKYYTIDQYAQRHRLKNVSTQLFNNFSDDVNAVLTLKDSIVSFTKHPFNSLSGISKEGKDWISKKNKRKLNSSEYEKFSDSIAVFSDGSQYGLPLFAYLYLIRSDSLFKEIPESLLLENRPVNEIFVIDSSGKMIKGVSQRAFPKFITIDLSKRLYFQNAIDSNKSWYNDGSRFYIESIKSYQTTKMETAFSFPLNRELANKFGAPVLAITSELPSVYHQTLPPDIQYMVINEQGDVLFHSTKTKNLHENFLDECNTNAKILGAIRYRTNTQATISYNEKKWMAEIQPVKNSPLYHITLMDLEHAQNLNARIFMVTFYFIVLTFIFIVLGMLIMMVPLSKTSFFSDKRWPLKWLVFNANNYPYYRKTLAIQVILFLAQGIGIFIIKAPVTLLIYQLFFIAVSALSPLLLLSNGIQSSKNKLSKLSNLAISLTLILLVLILYVLFKIGPVQAMIVPAFLFLLLLIFHTETTEEVKQPGKTEVVESSFKKLWLNIDNKIEKYLPANKTYLIYMFTWLICLTALPVVEYYHVVKKQEMKLWRWNEMKTMADQNLYLAKEKFYNKLVFTNEKDTVNSSIDTTKQNWVSPVLGNRLDHLTFDMKRSKASGCLPSDKTKKPGKLWASPADSVYFTLPDPVTRNYEVKALLKNQNISNEWKVSKNEFTYTKAGTVGCVKVCAGKSKTIPFLNWFLYVLLPVLLVAIFSWKLFIFLSDNLLNTISAKWINPKEYDWEKALDKKQKHPILCISLQADRSLKQVKSLVKTKLESSVQVLHANELVLSKYSYKSSPLSKHKVLWIYGFDKLIHELENHRNLLTNLETIKKTAKQKLILCLPFSKEYLEETFDYFLKHTDKEKLDLVQIERLRKGWNILLGDFKTLLEKYVPESTASSSADQATPKAASATELQAAVTVKPKDELLLELQQKEHQYYYLWNNLSGMEKMILSDLAEDGMLNVKNKYLINKLAAKGLLEQKPYPKLFNESFRLFINHIADANQDQPPEYKQNRKGKWHSMRYLIILIIIPLVGFIFIAQGASIEKVIGVFSGILALLSGVMRLLSTDAIKT